MNVFLPTALQQNSNKFYKKKNKNTHRKHIREEKPNKFEQIMFRIHIPSRQTKKQQLGKKQKKNEIKCGKNREKTKINKQNNNLFSTEILNRICTDAYTSIPTYLIHIRKAVQY